MRHTRAKKFLALLLAVILTAGALPMGARAYEMASPDFVNTFTAGGTQNMAALDKDGNVWTWGDNQFGQLGNGTTKDSTKPIKVLSNVVQISAGGGVCMAIKKDNSLWGWGLNSVGQLGNGGKGNSTSGDGLTIQTKPIKLMDGVKFVSEGYEITAIIKTDNSLWVCGNGWNLFRDESGTWENHTDCKTPKKVMQDVLAVCAGESGGIAILKTDHSLWGAGFPFANMNGDDSRVTIANPIKIADNVQAASVGEHTMALIKTDGTLWTRGVNNFYGEVGQGNNLSGRSFENLTKVLDNVKTVSDGGYHMVAVKNDGSLWAWGLNSDGQLGNGGKGNSTLSQKTCQDVPVKIMDGVVDARAAVYNTIVLKKDGTLWTCGSNQWGQLGLGNTTGKNTFQKVPGLTVSTGSTPVKPVEPPKPTVAGFSDVFEDAYYADAVKWAVENGVTSGTDKTHFSPSASCTRAQAVTFLWRALGKPEPAGTSGGFTDVAADSYYEKAVRWAVESGVTTGATATTFNPNAPCTRAQIVTFLYRAAGSPETAGTGTFQDVKAGDYYENAVNWAVANNITTGTSKTAFSPGKDCIRGQIVTFLYRNR